MLQRHSRKHGCKTSCSMAQIPTANPRRRPQGDGCYRGAGAGGVAASITSCLAKKTCLEGLDDATRLPAAPMDLLTDGSIAGGLSATLDSMMRLATARGDIGLSCISSISAEKKKRRCMARKKARAYRRHPRVTQLFHPHWIGGSLPGGETLWRRAVVLNRSASKLARAHFAHYYIEGEPETDFLKITKARGKSACSIRPSAAGTCSPTPSTCSVSSTRRRAYAPRRDFRPLIPAAQPLRARDHAPRAAQLADAALVFTGRGNRRGASPERAAWYGRRSSSCRTSSLQGDELSDYIEAHGSSARHLFRFKTCSSCSGNLKRRKTSAR